MKRFLLVILLLSIIFGAAAEDLNDMHITAHQLNGRTRPSKKSMVEVVFDHNDTVSPTGKWSADHKWVEVIGGENGTVWCCVDYLSERDDVFTVYSLNPGKIRVRSQQGAGKVTGSVKKEQRIEITQVVMGYGRCKRGWVDLSYFIEEEE